MEILYNYHDNLIDQVNNNFYRYLWNEVKWNQRMLVIKGPRGSGKTTLMLQYIRFGLKKPREQALYVTADHYWFYTHNLVETAEAFYKNGGRYLFIDEIHKYPSWSTELKNIYDGYPKLSVVFSSSSALDIYRGSADLSRRVITYELPGLSFREYLEFSGYPRITSVSLIDLIKHHREIAIEIKKQIQPLPHFKKYLQYGYLPIFKESDANEIPIRLSQTITTIIESDLNYINDYSIGTAFKIKKLLGVLAESAPFKPNVSAIANKLDVSRDSVYAWFVHLQNARLLNLVSADGKGISLLQKPDKIYLENTNLSYALKLNPDIGSVRETFLLNQLINSKSAVRLPKAGDFIVDDIVIEVGGKNKTKKQIKEYDLGILAVDDIETGSLNKIPLWLFGFLY